MQEVLVIKIGGNIIDDEQALKQFLSQYAQIKQPKILVHGGGKLATELSTKLGIETKMIDGRRITDAATLKNVTMVYAGWINKTIVAQLQAKNCNAIGLSGADAKLILAHKRKHPSIDYGFVGDIEKINTTFLSALLQDNYAPILAPISVDTNGQLLNTNADTIASSIAIALSQNSKIKLFYCFEKKGLLANKEDENSYIKEIKSNEIQNLIDNQTIVAGMIPKVHNIHQAIEHGVNEVVLCHALDIVDIINENTIFGTIFRKI